MAVPAGGVAAVVFDLDGVLIESELIWTRVREQVTRENGGTWTEEAPERMSGLSSIEWATYMRDELGVTMEPDEISDAVVEHLQTEFRRELPLFPGARDAVGALAARWPLALASSANRPLIDLVLELADIGEHFQATVSSEEVPRGKPEPDVYLEAAKRLDVPPGSCVAIEDSSSGIRAAAGAGMKVIAIPNTDLPPDPAVVALAAVTIPGVSELTPALVEAVALGS
jgi:HAD superfamily hydrolase (TIGR01509 family)